LKVSELSTSDLRARLASAGLCLPCGPYTVRLRSPLPVIAEGLATLYPDYELAADDAFIDFVVTLAPGRGLRRFIRPQVIFDCDGRRPFKPLPQGQALAMMEWGLNWVLTSHAHQWMLIHAAVVERDGRAMVLAADPGSGKSTLCAALVLRGWRLLSDEMAFVSLLDGRLLPIARPVSLKNRSIEVIRALSSAAVIGPSSFDTVKGTVAHLRPPADSVARREQTVSAGLLVFPRYGAGQALSLQPVARAQALMELVSHTFNYSVLGSEAFEALAGLVESAPAYRLAYSDFDTLHPALDALWAAPR
jgi:HprK-related kinase A